MLKFKYFHILSLLYFSLSKKQKELSNYHKYNITNTIYPDRHSLY